jgi:flavin-dependent dehydrogenase
MIDRTRFDKTLAIHALEAGADLCNAFVLSCRDGEVVARRNGIEARFRGRVIIGADGASSVVTRGHQEVGYLSALQYEVGLNGDEDWMELISPLPTGPGFGWFVPSGRTARLGVAVERSHAKVLKAAANALLRRYEADRRIFPNAILGASGGLIPVSGRNLESGPGVLPAGDACGLAGPLGGAGIASAVLLGEVSGRVAAASVHADDPGLLADYPAEALKMTPGSGNDRVHPLLNVRGGIEVLGNWNPPLAPA